MKNLFVLCSICFSVSLAADAPQNKFGEFYPVSLFESQTAAAAVKSDEGAELSKAGSSLEKPESFESLRVKLQKDGSVLAAVLAAFDREYAEARERAVPTGIDVEFATKGLRALVSHAQKTYAHDPAAAESLMVQINNRLQPLLAEFKPNAPYKRVFLNIAPPAGVPNAATGMSPDAIADPEMRAQYLRDRAENQANNVYNIRQNALRSFFIGMKRLRAFRPELQHLDARIDAVDDPRLDEMLQSSRKK